MIGGVVAGYDGTFRATVVDDADPMQQNRLLVVVPDVYGEVSVWAVSSLPAGDWSPRPAIDDLVWVSFEHGDTDYPVWQPDQGANDGTGGGGGYIGKYRGVVVANDDPMQSNRLEVIVPEIDPSPAWAIPSDDCRYTEPPSVGVEVWIEYEYGDPAYPRWVGFA